MNEYEDVHDITYRAVDTIGLSCRECALFSPDMEQCFNAPACTANEREDGREIIWVKADAQE